MNAVLQALSPGGAHVSEQVTIAVIALIGVGLTAALALIGGVVAAVIGARQQGLVALVGSLQEEVERQDGRITELEHGLDEERQQKRAAIEYAHELLRFIATGAPPPPPDWPAGLKR